MSVSPPEDAPSTLPSDLGEGPRFHDRRMRRRVFLSALLGSTVEYYDFMAYAVAATLVFGPVFFAPAGSSSSPSPAWRLASRFAHSAGSCWGTSGIATAARAC
jgi:hypothetical protein